MADMFVRSQILQAQIDGGNFHIGIRNLTAEDAALIAMRPDIKVPHVMVSLITGARTDIFYPEKTPL